MTTISASLQAHLQANGQDALLLTLAGLSPAELEPLTAQLEQLDWDLFASLRGLALASGDEASKAPLEPLDPLVPTAEDRQRWSAVGWEALRAGRVALLVVAGGQGTRLGWDGPKGTYPVGPVSRKSLFQGFAEQIRALSERAGAPLPLYVLTSALNRDATAAFFQEHTFFGLASDQVRFLVQRDLPNVDLQGNLVRAAPDSIARSPNGHGGSLLALREGGALDAMRAAGQDLLFYWQVDNPLCAIADPAFLGAHLEAGAQASTKVVPKRAPGEKVGVLALRQGRTHVVEYSEMSSAEQSERAPSGALAHRAGNIAVHLFDREFVSRNTENVEYHLARKAVPLVDASGALTQPTTPNVIKFETFVFDVLPRAETHVTFEVAREEEFEPLKNASGADSPETVRAAISARSRRWIEANGHKLPAETTCEVSPLRALGPDDLKGLALPTPLPAQLYLE